MATPSKITYATLSAPSEELHRAFEAAVERTRGDLGATHPIWIAGQSLSERESFENRSPSDTRLLVGRFQSARREDARSAVAHASEGFDAWSHTPWQERVRILRRAAELIAERRFDLAALMSFEAGKNRFESLADVEESADLIRWNCQLMEEAEGFDRPMGQLSPNEKTRDILRPYGVWAVISPFNFPMALATGMSTGALLGGNTVVFKPSSDAPACGLKLYEILTEAGVPVEAIHYVTGNGSTVGRELVENPAVSGLVFTGSKEVGFSIYRDFSRERPRPSILELGGKNPAIVTRHADLEKAAEGVMRAAFGYGGQKCSACSRVLVENDVSKKFTELLVEKTRNIVVGDPLLRETFLGPVINEAARRTFEQASEEARQDGRILHGGKIPRDDALAHGFFVEPTLVTGLSFDHRLFQEELFLPFLTMGEVDSLDHAIEVANDVEYGLTAGIFSEDPKEIETFFDRIEAGVCHANRRSGATTGAWPGVNPFCGWKSSGSSGKGVCGPYYVQQFLREQSRTILE
jgi:1-pyrroline-5-carboxylate dehydrogenase